MARVSKRSYRRAGKLLPSSARHLKGRSVRLSPGQTVEWHSTRDREELIVVWRGSVALEVQQRPEHIRALTLTAGDTAFLTSRVWHRVVNRSRRPAQYIYVTA